MLRALAFFLPLLLAATLAPGTAHAQAFSFVQIVSLDDMRGFVRDAFPLGTARDAVHSVLAIQGGGSLYQHPEQQGVEKYVFDVDLCDIYVWRWNISANFDDAGVLTQIYVNGEPIHPGGDPLVDPQLRARNGAEQAILQATMARPEASKGESTLVFLIYDLDTSSSSVSDQFIVGAGPTRADPANLGEVHAYTNVERWRSIFSTETPGVHAYEGACP